MLPAPGGGIARRQCGVPRQRDAVYKAHFGVQSVLLQPYAF